MPKRQLAETFRTDFLGHFIPTFENGHEFIDVVLYCRFFHDEGHIKSNCCWDVFPGGGGGKIVFSAESDVETFYLSVVPRC